MTLTPTLSPKGEGVAIPSLLWGEGSGEGSDFAYQKVYGSKVILKLSNCQ